MQTWGINKDSLISALRINTQNTVTRGLWFTRCNTRLLPSNLFSRVDLPIRAAHNRHKTTVGFIFSHFGHTNCSSVFFSSGLFSFFCDWNQLQQTQQKYLQSHIPP